MVHQIPACTMSQRKILKIHYLKKLKQTERGSLKQKRKRSSERPKNKQIIALQTIRGNLTLDYQVLNLMLPSLMHRERQKDSRWLNMLIRPKLTFIRNLSKSKILRMTVMLKKIKVVAVKKKVSSIQHRNKSWREIYLWWDMMTMMSFLMRFMASKCDSLCMTRQWLLLQQCHWMQLMDRWWLAWHLNSFNISRSDSSRLKLWVNMNNSVSSSLTCQEWHRYQ